MRAPETSKEYGKSAAVSRISATFSGEVGKHCIGCFCADHLHQLFTRRPSHAGETSKRREQRLATSWSDSIHRVEFRSEITFAAREAMERDGESMRLVADALDQQEGGTAGGERDRILAIAREQQFLFLRETHRNEVGKAKLLQRGIRGRQLPFAAIDQNQVREGP